MNFMHKILLLPLLFITISATAQNNNSNTRNSQETFIRTNQIIPIKQGDSFAIRLPVTEPVHKSGNWIRRILKTGGIAAATYQAQRTVTANSKSLSTLQVHCWHLWASAQLLARISYLTNTPAQSSILNIRFTIVICRLCQAM